MRAIQLFLALFYMFSLSACGETPPAPPPSDPPAAVVTPAETPASQAPTPEIPAAQSGKVLVACFSCTNHTMDIAEKIAACLEGADLCAITPAVPYTAADLNYNTDCRANREQNDPAARPAISGSVESWDSCDVVFLGYPIWWGVPPKIMHTFMESYDFSGKTVIPFCTSGSSSYNDAAIRSLAAADTTWITGRRFAACTDAETVRAWVEGLDLPITANGEDAAVDTLYVSFNGHTYTAALAENPSAEAFAAWLKEQGGSVTVSAHDYGSFEKVGPLGTSLVQSNRQIDTVPGDIILYQGNNICLYYSTNSWNFTPLGKLSGDLSSLRADLGSGDVEITYSING